MCLNTFSSKLLFYATHGSIAYTYVSFGNLGMTLMEWDGSKGGDSECFNIFSKLYKEFYHFCTFLVTLYAWWNLLFGAHFLIVSSWKSDIGNESEVSFSLNFISTPTDNQSSNMCHLYLVYGKTLVHMTVKEWEKVTTLKYDLKLNNS
jgi:hypothetical protein